MSQLSLKKIKLGDNADLSKNFVISTPAVADGTLTIERENGTDVLTVDASGKVTCTLTDNLLPIGVGQTWRDLTASRASSTPYTNNTGRPIVVSVINSFVDSGIQLTVDGLAVSKAGQTASGTANDNNTVTAIIPNGSVYSITTYIGSTLTWFELR